MLTIFACPKPFTDPHIAIIQRNAITSWTLLRPKPEIILFGDEVGVTEICQELGLRHVPDVTSNEYGTPLLNDIFGKAQRLATYDVLCYLNADIIVMNDFPSAVFQAKAFGDSFLLVGDRWNLDIENYLDFAQPHWGEHLRQLAVERGQFFRLFGSDYFGFPRGLYKEMPPLAIGRGAFDTWLFWSARSLRVPIVDATKVVMAIHQSHDYSHANAKDGAELMNSEEVRRNFELAGIPHRWERLLLDATHELTARGIQRIWGRRVRFRIQSAVMDILVYRLGPIRHRLGLRRASLSRIKSLLASVEAGLKGHGV